MGQVRQELAVVYLGDDPEGKAFQVVRWMNEPSTQVLTRLKGFHVCFEMSVDHRRVLCDLTAGNWDFSDCTCSLPFSTIDEANALPKKSAHDIARVAVYSLKVLVRVTKDCLNVVGIRENTEE
jgi:hypothetical protein